jgi:hypothetical protein
MARLLLVLALVAGACVAPGAAAQRPPNVIGTVAGAPAVAACPPGDPCDPPITVTVLTFSRGGHVTASILASTRFRLRLAPGRYSIAARAPAAPRAHGPGGGVRVRPSTVRVPRKGVVHLHLTLTAVG